MPKTKTPAPKDREDDFFDELLEIAIIDELINGGKKPASSGDKKPGRK